MSKTSAQMGLLSIGIALAAAVPAQAGALDREGVPAAPPPPPPIPIPDYHSCIVDIQAGIHNCDGASDPPVVEIIPISEDQRKRRAIVHLNRENRWKTFVLRVEVCNADGWTVHIGDSPTNDGYGGDMASTNHDAEAFALDNRLDVFESDIGTSALTCRFTGPPNPSGCTLQQWVVQNDYFDFDPAVGFSNPLSICGNGALFDFPDYDEPDSEDPRGAYADKLYVGLNRTYGSGLRTGSGVQWACFFVTTEETLDEGLIDKVCAY